jgi:hypothetical protein
VTGAAWERRASGLWSPSATRRRRQPGPAAPVPPGPPPDPDPEEPTTLLGVGSGTDSFSLWPRSEQTTTGDWYVDPNAGTNGSGTLGDPFNNLGSAFSAVSDGQRILVRGGALSISSTISRNTNWATGIEVWGYGDERPIIDRGGSGDLLSFGGSARREHWRGFEFRNAGRFTVFITGSDITIEDCWGHNGTSNGFYIFGANPTGNVVQDCVAWNIGSASGTGIDVFKCAGPDSSNRNQGGNAFVRCFARWGSDDNFDLFNSHDNLIVDCVSHRAGYHWDGSSEVSVGNGSGFKLGDGNSPSNPGGNTIRGSLAIQNKLHGITHNFTPGPTPIIKCTSIFNTWVGYQLHTESSFWSNIAYGNGGPADGKSSGSIEGAHNTWNLGITDPKFAGAGVRDYSLAQDSPCLDVAHDGGHLGASWAALELAKAWLPKALT